MPFLEKEKKSTLIYTSLIIYLSFISIELLIISMVIEQLYRPPVVDLADTVFTSE